MPSANTPEARKRCEKLDRGHVKVELIRELAVGVTHRKLAEKYDVTVDAINRFKQRHKPRIAEVKADLENEFVGLWVASKAARIGEYETMIEDLEAQTLRALEGLGDRETLIEMLKAGAEVEEIAELAGDVSETLVRLAKEKTRALRAVAEELGQLPSRLSLQVNAGQSAVLKLEGVDLDKL